MVMAVKVVVGYWWWWWHISGDGGGCVGRVLRLSGFLCLILNQGFSVIAARVFAEIKSDSSHLGNISILLTTRGKVHFYKYQSMCCAFCASSQYY